MATVASLRMLSVGMFTFPVDVLSTLPAPQSFKTVCCGVTEPHAPTGITMPKTCAHCGVVTDTSALRKAAKAGNEWILLDETMVAQKPDNRRIALNVHPKPEFENATVVGAKSYWLKPSKNSDPTGYVAIRELVKQDSDRAYVAVWAVRSKPVMYQLIVQGNALILMERVHVDDANPAPVVDGTVSERDLTNIGLLAGSELKPFRREDYTDNSLSELLATGERVAVDGQSETPTSSLSDLLAAMANELTPVRPARKPRAPRKPKTRATGASGSAGSVPTPSEGAA